MSNPRQWEAATGFAGTKSDEHAEAVDVCVCYWKRLIFEYCETRSACWQCGYHIHVAAYSADILSAKAHVPRKSREVMKLAKGKLLNGGPRRTIGAQIMEEIRKLNAIEARC